MDHRRSPASVRRTSRRRRGWSAARDASTLLAGAFAACAGAGGAPSDRSAELPPISPNRPTFSDGTSLVPTGHVQLETGWTFTKRATAGVDGVRHNVPELLLRARVADTVELRALWNGVVATDVDGAGRDHGASDPALGIVVPLFDQGDLAPAIAIEALSTLGIADDTFGSGHADPTGKLLWSYGAGRLPEWFAVGGNLIASWPTEAGDRFTQTASSVWITITAPGPDTSWFAEWYVVSRPANNVASTRSVDCGVVQRLSPRVAVDARVGFGLDDRADDFFTGVGLSLLF